MMKARLATLKIACRINTCSAGAANPNQVEPENDKGTERRVRLQEA